MRCESSLFAPARFDPAVDFLFGQPAPGSKWPSRTARSRQPSFVACARLNRESRWFESWTSGRVPETGSLSRPLQPVQLQIEPAEDGQKARFGVMQRLGEPFLLDVGQNLASYSYRNLRSRAEFIRAVKPEMRIKLDGAWYEVGGLVGQPERSYLVEAVVARDEEFAGQVPVHWFDHQPTRRALCLETEIQRPQFTLATQGLYAYRCITRRPKRWPRATSNLELTVHYELYEGNPRAVPNRSPLKKCRRRERSGRRDRDRDSGRSPRPDWEYPRRERLLFPLGQPCSGRLPRHGGPFQGDQLGKRRSIWRAEPRPIGEWTRNMIPGRIRLRSRIDSWATLFAT